LRPIILAGGIVARPYQPQDAAALLVAVDADRARLGRWMPWVPYSTTASDFAAFISTVTRREEAGTGYHRGLFVGDAVVGGFGTDLDLLNREAEVGYWLAEPHEGRGLITAAMRALLGFLFDEVEVNRVMLRAAVGNTRSRAVAERLGFTLEGVQRQALILDEVPTDAAMYSLLKPEWVGRDQ
jgi:ribosomal-protein-serine acetyltransferase